MIQDPCFRAEEFKDEAMFLLATTVVEGEQSQEDQPAPSEQLVVVA